LGLGRDRAMVVAHGVIDGVSLGTGRGQMATGIRPVWVCLHAPILQARS
jgi:hypothetical protein